MMNLWFATPSHGSCAGDCFDHISVFILDHNIPSSLDDVCTSGAGWWLLREVREILLVWHEAIFFITDLERNALINYKCRWVPWVDFHLVTRLQHSRGFSALVMGREDRRLSGDACDGHVRLRFSMPRMGMLSETNHVWVCARAFTKRLLKIITATLVAHTLVAQMHVGRRSDIDGTGLAHIRPAIVEWRIRVLLVHSRYGRAMVILILFIMEGCLGSVRNTVHRLAPFRVD